MQITINATAVNIPAAWQDETLLAFLRENQSLVGAKFGCGAGQCGACTVIVNGATQRACVLRVRDLANAKIETVEGLAASGGALHAVQQAWLDAAVAQCGYCQSGQIMSTVALLRLAPKPTPAQVDAALAGNLCRCGTQQRIRAAVARAVTLNAQVVK
jgi:isoquinoline 1-oxidoreductase subunit alpha